MSKDIAHGSSTQMKINNITKLYIHYKTNK